MTIEDVVDVGRISDGSSVTTGGTGLPARQDKAPREVAGKSPIGGLPTSRSWSVADLTQANISRPRFTSVIISPAGFFQMNGWGSSFQLLVQCRVASLN